MILRFFQLPPRRPRRRGRGYACTLYFSSACVFVAIFGADPARGASGGFQIGMNFLDAPYNSDVLGGFDSNGQFDNRYTPVMITDPASRAVTSGAFSGWTEAKSRRAVTLAVEDAFRAVDTGDAGRTLDIAIYQGPVPTSAGTRRLNVLLGDNASISSDQVGESVEGAFNTGGAPNDSDAGAIYLRHLDQTPGAVFTTSSQVINNIAGTTAHEIGHLFNLQHVPVGTTAPYPIMASGGTGLTVNQRLTLRRFEASPAAQAGGLSSAGLLIQGIGTVRKTDFTRDGVTTVSGDGVILRRNLGRTDALFQEGDATGDHSVDVSRDGVALRRDLAIGSTASLLTSGRSIVAPGTAAASLDPATGRILLSENGIGFFEIQSAAGNIIAANALDPTAIGGFGDAPSSHLINYLTFGTFATFDDLSLGAILPPGFLNVNDLTLRYLNGEQKEVFAPVTLVPEPGIGVIVLGAMAAVSQCRRRRSSNMAM